MSESSTKVGEVSIKLGVDASGVEAQAKAGAEKAAAASEKAILDKTAAQAAKISAKQKQLSAQWAKERADAAAAEEREKQRIIADVQKSVADEAQSAPSSSGSDGPDLGAKSAAKKAQKTLNDSIGAVQGIMGKMFYVGAVASGFYALGGVLRDRVIAVIESGTDKAKKFRESMDFTNVKQSLEQTGAKLQELEAKLGENKSSFMSEAVNTIMGDSTAQLEEEIKSLRGTAQNLRGADNAAKVREAKKALADIATEQKKAGQTESEQAVQRYEDTQKQIKKIVSDANNDPGAQAAADAALKAAKARENDELDSIDKKAYADRMAERLAKEKEASDAIKALTEMRESATSDASGPRQQEEMAFQKKLKDARDAALVQGGGLNPLMQAELDRTVEAITKAHQKAAKQIEQSYVQAFMAIKQQSNTIFGGDAAESMTGLGGLLNFTQTTTNANLGAERITSNGGF